MRTSISFNDPMMVALLAGRKTVTRRLLDFPHTSEGTAWAKAIYEDGGGNWIAWSTDNPGLAEFTKKAYPHGEGFPCPYGKVGDVLVVQETYALRDDVDPKQDQEKALHYIKYRADFIGQDAQGASWHPYIRWRFADFMPLWASRCKVRITSVGAEHLQDITEAEAMAEGVERLVLSPEFYEGIRVHPMTSTYIEAFKKLWDSIYRGRYPWEINPWVWRLGLEVVKL